MSVNDPEPPPVPNTSRPVWELVIEDMRARDVAGRAKYGAPLQAGNGRKPLIDAYQEALDLVVYMRQEIEERAALTAERDRLKERNVRQKSIIEHCPDALMHMIGMDEDEWPLAKLRAQVERLERALRQYGVHNGEFNHRTPACASLSQEPWGAPGGACDCGLDAALAHEDKEGSRG